MPRRNVAPDELAATQDQVSIAADVHPRDERSHGRNQIGLGNGIDELAQTWRLGVGEDGPRATSAPWGSAAGRIAGVSLPALLVHLAGPRPAVGSQRRTDSGLSG